MATGSKKEVEQRNEQQPAMKTPPVVSQKEWEAAHQQLLVKEKALTRSRDALAAERRRMPWMAVEKKYEFEGPKGKVSLLDLFERRRQLVLYRAFFEPGVFGWTDHACRGCSLGADQVAHLAHLNARDTTLAYASRAPQADIARLKARMEWDMPWYTITDAFDTDFGVNEWHGHNVFFRDGERVFRTYFINGRGDEAMGSTWSYLDITPLGRQETWEDSPEGYPQTPPYIAHLRSPPARTLPTISKKLWGEDRVTIQLADGSLFSMPVSWTDVVPADAYTSVGGGRSRFRVEDLMALADLLALKRSR